MFSSELLFSAEGCAMKNAVLFFRLQIIAEGKNWFCESLIKKIPTHSLFYAFVLYCLPAGFNFDFANQRCHTNDINNKNSMIH